MPKLLFVVAALMWLFVSSTWAARQFRVAVTSDEHDCNPGDGVCSTRSSSANPCPNFDTECTLRAAIEEINAGTNQSAQIELISFSTNVMTITLTENLPPITKQVSIYMTGRWELNGNGHEGLVFLGGNSSVGGLAIYGCANGVVFRGKGGNGVNCRIGTDYPGLHERSNAGDGVLIDGSSNNVVNGLISGNQNNGVRIINGSINNTVRAFIGTDISGTNRLGNGGNGVYIVQSPSNHILGLNCIISGNQGNGIVIEGTRSVGNQVRGCYIGTDSNGMVALPNSLNGVLISDAPSNFVGFIDSFFSRDAGIISGNGGDGLKITGSGAVANSLYHAGVGTDRTRTNALPNRGAGVSISDNASGNSIGSREAATDQDHFYPTVIAFNGQQGIVISGGARNDMPGASIFSNGGLEIDLGGDGPTANDMTDADSGPNGLLNFPVLTFAGPGFFGTKITGTFRSRPKTDFIITYYSSLSCDPSGSGEALYPLDFENYTTDANGFVAINTEVLKRLPIGRAITSTATVSYNYPDSGSTSEFSPCVHVGFVPGPTRIAFTSDMFSVGEGDGMATITVIRNGDAGTEVSAHVVAGTLGDSSLDAEPGLDFQPVSVDVHFGAGETNKSISIPIVDDTEAELPEQVLLSITSVAADAQFGAISNAVLQIMDNEPAEISFRLFGERLGTLGGEIVLENSGANTVQVQRRGNPNIPVSVEFDTKNGTAKQLFDFEIAAGTLQFAPGQFVAELPFKPIDNPVADGDRYFFLTLKNPQPAGVRLGLARSSVLILDDEAPFTLKGVSITDTGGDSATVSLKGNGWVQIKSATALVTKAATVLPAAGVHGSAFDIVLSETDATSVFNLKVTKGAAGDGLVNINSIVARGGLKALNLKSANLTGDGIFVGGSLGSLTIADVQNGAVILAGGTNTQPASTLTAHVIGDDSVIAFGTPIRTFTAASVGRSEIRAPSLSTLTIRGDKKLAVRGDFAGTLLLSGEGVAKGKAVLGKATIASSISNALIDVNGSIGPVSVGQIVNSALRAGFVPADSTNALAGGGWIPGAKIASVTTRATTDSFVNSIIAADQVGTVKLTSVRIDNSARPFGVIVGQSVRSVLAPSFKWNPAGASVQSTGDFHVKVLNTE